MYLAQHPRLPRLEALKILPEDISADPEFRQRFAREADIASSLWHPHIVAVHDRGEHDGQLWIAMDYVEGKDAARMMRERYPHGMPTRDAIEIITDIADALDYAHEQYLLHRDVKPANILLTDPRKGDRRILLADFGIAKASNETQGLTATNMTVGSVAYAAPEQLTGKPLDGRADQYALACTAFHLLTGQQPFVNTNPAVVIGNHISSPPPRLAALRADLGSMENVLAKAMAKEPYLRFETCREFATALAHGDATWTSSTADTQYAFNVATASPPRAVSEAPNSAKAPGDWSSRRTMLIAVGAAALLAVGIVAYVAASLGRGPSPVPPTAAPTTPITPWDESYEPPQRPRTETVTETATATVAPPTAPRTPAPRQPPAPVPSIPSGDLGLSTRISDPPCNGQGIAVLGSVTTPGMYAGGVQKLLNENPGASYLRTDQSCPSLRQADDEGDPIYAVFRYAGETMPEVCAAVRSAGGGAYGKWLDYETPASYQLPC